MNNIWVFIAVNIIAVMLIGSADITWYKYIKYNEELNKRIETNTAESILVKETTPEIDYDELVRLSEEGLKVATVNEIVPDTNPGNLYEAITATRTKTKYATPSYFSKIESGSNILFITDDRFKDIRKSVRLDYDIDLINCNTSNIKDMYDIVKEVDPDSYKNIILSPILCDIDKNKYANYLNKILYHILYTKQNKPTVTYIKSNVVNNTQNLLENGYENLGEKRFNMLDISGILDKQNSDDGYHFNTFSSAITAMEYILGKI